MKLTPERIKAYSLAIDDYWCLPHVDVSPQVPQAEYIRVDKCEALESENRDLRAVVAAFMNGVDQYHPVDEEFTDIFAPICGVANRMGVDGGNGAAFLVARAQSTVEGVEPVRVVSEQGHTYIEGGQTVPLVTPTAGEDPR